MKADELVSRVEELQLLAKRISRYEDPISQFRSLAYLKPATWSKGCGWNQSKLIFLVSSVDLGIFKENKALVIWMGGVLIIVHVPESLCMNVVYYQRMMQSCFWEFIIMDLETGRR